MATTSSGLGALDILLVQACRYVFTLRVSSACKGGWCSILDKYLNDLFRCAGIRSSKYPGEGCSYVRKRLVFAILGSDKPCSDVLSEQGCEVIGLLRTSNPLPKSQITLNIGSICNIFFLL